MLCMVFKVRRQYEDLIGVAFSDGLEHIELINRGAKFLRDGFVMSQLDGEGTRIMGDQQKRHNKQVCMDSALRSLASDRSSDSVSNFSFKSAHTHKIQQSRESVQC